MLKDLLSKQAEKAGDTCSGQRLREHGLEKDSVTEDSMQWRKLGGWGRGKRFQIWPRKWD